MKIDTALYNNEKRHQLEGYFIVGSSVLGACRYSIFLCFLPFFSLVRSLTPPTVRWREEALFVLSTYSICVIGHGIGGKYIPIMARLAKARQWSKR